MWAQNLCQDCLAGLIQKTISVADSTPEKKREALEAALAYLEEHFRLEEPPPRMAERLQNIIKKITQDEDPFKGVKVEEIRLAKKLAFRLKGNYGESFSDLIAFASLGNAIDFFRNPKELTQKVSRGVSFSVDHRNEAARRLKEARLVLYLADNAGEIFFDLPLLKSLKRMGKEIFLAVKESPIQNDLSLADLKHIGPLPVKVIASGTFVGLDLKRATLEFKRLFKRADFIIAKGMGHFETMDELAEADRLLFILEAKCLPVAEALQAPLGSQVCWLKGL
ncbi:damage-control phosphatase ARMT1 family protein [Thermosulfuriphilus sp.]